MTATLHFVGGEKGGVGKSVMARILAQYCIDKELPFLGFDTDRSHASFQRFYRDYASKTVIDDYQSLDAIAEAIATEPDRQVLVDLAAQTMAPLSQWIDDSEVVTMLKDEGIWVRFWHVMDDGRDSLSTLENLVQTYGDKVAYTIVLNHGRGAKFNAFHESEVKKQVMDLGATVLELRKLHEASMRKIDAHDTSFWAAVNVKGTPTSLGMLERNRVKVWLNRTYEDLKGLIG